MALGFYDGASTPEQLARRRAELDFLASGMGRAQNVGQGVGDIFRGIGVGLGRYRANKQENTGIEGANKAWSAFNSFGSPQTPPQSPQVSGGAAFPNPATMTPPTAPKQSYGGFNGIPPSQSVSGENLAKPSNGSSFLAALDRNEGGGSYDTLFGHAQKNGQFAGTRVSGMSIADAINFSDPNGAYANSVKGQIGRVATPMGRYQIVGSTLRNAVKEMGLDPSTPFNQQTQDAIAMHLAKKRVMSAGSMGGKINALRQEWHGFNNVPDSQMAQIVTEIQNGSSQPVQVASNDPQGAFAMPASAPPNDMAQAQPIPQPVQQQVAQAQPPVQQQGGADNARLKQLWELSQNQFLNPAQQSMAKMLFEQEMQKQDPSYQMKLQGDQLGLEKSRLELQQMQHPDQVPLTPIQKMQLQKMQQDIENGNLIEVGGSLVDRKTMKPVFTDPNKAGGVEYGLQPFMARDEKGNLVPYQLSKNGTLKKVELPPGQTPAPNLQYLDTGTGFNPVDKHGGTVPESVAPIQKDVSGEATANALGKDQGANVALLKSMTAKLPGLEQVVSELDQLADKATYTAGGQIYNEARKQLGFGASEGAIARTEYQAKVANQVLPLMRDTFGSQFTVEEGRRLLATLGDPDVSPAEKKATLHAFIEQKRRDIEGLSIQTRTQVAPNQGLAPPVFSPFGQQAPSGNQKRVEEMTDDELEAIVNGQ